ncbi:ribosome recycling factor domain-containing protein [Radiomyces spectabilis]|uniref:ribosome recycling factor domain-containing protein n=1 Tax=Radiomyces spectabilis TaxID=64574 RepID=UPI002220BF95|nr:ribosome recycling factor domain-containing protein [Radiomyces spectabilis]KAI8377495.1 ribosome recycling factor domain-containing protein [Radiomyces spectabilis]
MHVRPALGVQRPVTAAAVQSIVVRSYAKKSKASKKGGASKGAEDEVAAADVELQYDTKQTEERFTHAIDWLKDHFATMRVGRANPALLDNVRVRIETSNYPLRDLAQITIRDPQTLLVTVHDADYLSAVDKSIRESGLGLNPVVDNKLIRVPIPKPSKESRDKMTKLAHQTAEQAKSKIRAIRQDGMKQLKADAAHQSKDDIKKLEKQVQALTDKYNKSVDDMLKTKSKEILA